MKMELFKKKFNAGHWRTLQSSGDKRMLSDLQLVYMVPRNSTQLLNINTTKFQVEREPCSLININMINITTSNIGVSIISLHDTQRLHNLKRVIINLMNLAHI